MRILHYSLGVYPQRTGGLNKYATDLIREQSKEHQVALLYPNGISLFRQRCFISRPSSFCGIDVFGLINGAPIPLFYGIRKPSDFINTRIDTASFEKFYSIFKPEVLHIHTLMGLPKEAVSFFKSKGIRIVFTSHDYFGICPRVNLINNKGLLCEGPSENHCKSCNVNAPSTFFIRIRTSSLAYNLRDIIRWIKNLLHF